FGDEWPTDRPARTGDENVHGDSPASVACVISSPPGSPPPLGSAGGGSPGGQARGLHRLAERPGRRGLGTARHGGAQEECAHDAWRDGSREKASGKPVRAPGHVFLLRAWARGRK